VVVVVGDNWVAEQDANLYGVAGGTGERRGAERRRGMERVVSTIGGPRDHDWRTFFSP
jgi:hypothetical protein